MKKVLSLIVAVIMLVSMIPTVFADGTITDSNGGNNTTVTYTGTGAESWTVTVPADMKPGDTADVVASGTWASNRKLTVTADSSVRLVNNLNNDEYKDLDVTFTSIELVGSNTTAVSATKNISVEGITDALFGTWSGEFNYNVEISDTAKMISFKINKLGDFQAQEGMTWLQWLQSDFSPYDLKEVNHFLEEGYTHNNTDTILTTGNPLMDVTMGDVIVDGATYQPYPKD